MESCINRPNSSQSSCTCEVLRFTTRLPARLPIILEYASASSRASGSVLRAQWLCGALRIRCCSKISATPGGGATSCPITSPAPAMQTNHATRPTWATKGRNFRAAADDIPAERNRPAQASSSSGAVLPIFWCYAVAWTRGRPGLVLRLRSHASIEARSRKGPAAVSTTATGKPAILLNWRARWRDTPAISAISA